MNLHIKTKCLEYCLTYSKPSVHVKIIFITITVILHQAVPYVLGKISSALCVSTAF